MTDLLHRAARLIEHATQARDHIWAWWSAPCWRCGRRTRWVEVNYGARLCRGRCTREVDAEYFAACCAGGGLDAVDAAGEDGDLRVDRWWH